MALWQCMFVAKLGASTLGAGHTCWYNRVQVLQLACLAHICGRAEAERHADMHTSVSLVRRQLYSTTWPAACQSTIMTAMHCPRCWPGWPGTVPELWMRHGRLDISAPPPGISC